MNIAFYSVSKENHLSKKYDKKKKMKTVMRAVYSVYKGGRMKGRLAVDKFNLGQLTFILTAFYS